MNYKKIAGSLFLTAFVVGLNITGVAPVLGMIKEQYGNYGMQGIQFLQTLPYVLLTAGSAKRKLLSQGCFSLEFSVYFPALV